MKTSTAIVVCLLAALLLYCALSPGDRQSKGSDGGALNKSIIVQPASNPLTIDLERKLVPVKPAVKILP